MLIMRTVRDYQGGRMLEKKFSKLSDLRTIKRKLLQEKQSIDAIS